MRLLSGLGASTEEVEKAEAEAPVLPFVRQYLPIIAMSPKRGGRLVYGVSLRYSLESQWTNLLVGNVGWKLRLTAKSPEANQYIKNFLTQARYTIREGSTSAVDWDTKSYIQDPHKIPLHYFFKAGEAAAGKDFTIYVGERDRAVRMAKVLEQNLKPYIKTPLTRGAAAFKTDTAMTKSALVSGRFAAYGVKWRVGTNEVKMAWYGYQGFPAINGPDNEFSEEDDEAKPSGYARAYSQLASLFGSYFIGNEHPFVQSPPMSAAENSIL